jgi:prepilin peptidase CpaA
VAPFGHSPTGTVAGLVFTVLLLAAAIGDFRTRRIPNRLVLTIALLGVAYSILVEPVVPGLAKSVTGLLVGLGLWLPFYFLRWLGAGDVKLFAAAAAWLGPVAAVEGALIGACAGALLALLWMVGARGVRGTAETLGMATGAPAILAPDRSTVRSTLPYGVPIAFGAIWVGWLPSLILS